MTLTPIAKRYDDPVAQRVYDRIMACPDDETAALLTTMIVSKGIEYDLATHHDLLQRQVDTIVSKRLEDVKKGLSRSVSKASVDTAQVIAKAGFFDTLSEHQRSEWARKQQRDASGRFRTQTKKITYTATNPMSSKQESVLKIPNPKKNAGVNLSGSDRARYQQAYQEIQQMLRFTPANGEGAVVSVTGVTPHGQLEHPRDYLITRGGDLPKSLAGHFKNGGIIDQVDVHTPIDLSVGGAAFDLVGALGGGAYAGERAAAAIQTQPGTNRLKGANRLGTFANEWDQAGVANAPANRIFRRMSTGSRLLSDAAGDNIPMKAQLALKAGDYVGQYGEEAAKVIGPHADRAAYRYRGVEKKPAPGLQHTVDMFRRQFKDPDSARNALIYGVDRETARRVGTPIHADHTDSPIVDYFRKRLPEADLTHLQLKSGVVPPSQGIIIDRKGQVVTEAVGYGDDWYLPFNLKTLSKLKGGEYIRTRTWGGPTTEDIYAGLVSGARSVTVISHNGVYTIEFDDAFRGSRRYNDKAARMVKRYGHILDAVKSRDVTLAGMSPSRKRELETEANKARDKRLDPDGYKKRLEMLEAEERANPTMSQDDQRQVVIDYVNGRAAEVGPPDANWDWSDLAEDYVNRATAGMAADHARMAPDVPLDLAGARQAASQRVATPAGIIEAFGWEKGATKALAGAQDEYRAKQSPLNLNGEGYEKSMQALKEQFPYYISRVEWQPNKKGTVDTGYVKPGFLRPTMATIGYKDGPDGDTRQSAAQRNRYRGGQTAPAAETSQEAAAPAQASTMTAAAAPGVPVGVDPEWQKAREVSAVMALHAALRDPKKFHAQHPDPAFRNSPVGDAHKEKLRGVIETAEMPTAEFMDLLTREPEKAKEAVLRGAAYADEKNLLDVPSTLVQAVKTPGVVAKPKHPSLAAMLATPDADFEFGSAFEPGRAVANYEYEAKPFVDKIGLEDLDDSRMDAALNDVFDKARAALAVEDRFRSPQQMAELSRNVGDAVRLKQLKRMRDKAVQREKNETLSHTTSAAEAQSLAAPDPSNPFSQMFSSLPAGSQVVGFEIPENP